MTERRCETCRWWTQIDPTPGAGICAGGPPPIDGFNKNWLAELLQYRAPLACGEHQPREARDDAR